MKKYRHSLVEAAQTGALLSVILNVTFRLGWKRRWIQWEYMTYPIVLKALAEAVVETIALSIAFVLVAVYLNRRQP